MNAVESLDLWPNDIRADIVAPVAVLRAQEPALRRKTQAILRAEVRSLEIKEDGEEAGRSVHKLDLVAPALGEYRVTLLAAIHEINMVYPALIKSRVFDTSREPSKISVPMKLGIGSPTQPFLLSGTLLEIMNQKDGPDPEYRVAASQGHFVKLVSEVLQSSWVRSLIESLIARSNLVSQASNGQREKPNGDAPETAKE